VVNGWLVSRSTNSCTPHCRRCCIAGQCIISVAVNHSVVNILDFHLELPVFDLDRAICIHLIIIIMPNYTAIMYWVRQISNALDLLCLI